MFEIKVFRKSSDEVEVSTIESHNPNKAYKLFIQFLFEPDISRIVVSKK